MYQHQSPPLSFPPSSPADLNSFQQQSANLPSSIDIDQTLYDSFSALNLSPADDHRRRTTFSPPCTNFTHRGEGFSFNSLETNSRAQNSVNHNQGFYSGVGQTTIRTVDPFVVHQRASSSSFDHRFDFDFRSYLLAKERLFNNSNNLYMNQSHGVVSKLQNDLFLRVMSLHDLKGWVCFLAKDQDGCKVLQSKFESPTKDEIDLVFSEVMGSIADLMKDQHGNYIIQKLVCVCDDDQKALIVHELTERSVDIVLVCMSVYGTRAVQKLLENLNCRSLIMKVIRALHRCAAQLAVDPNGHHVVQFCVLHFDSDFNQPILNQIADNCFKVATDKSGCCVLQTCVEHARGAVRNRLVAEIMVNALQIAEDPFGFASQNLCININFYNYVLQHMVGLQSPELTSLLVSQLQGHFAYLSQNKYASNVVERCLTESELDISTKIILELVESPIAPSLLVDPYGNFVIQSALKVSRVS
ncbi:hypothetical protein QVD17_10357 [Tagetes erecta]|uniref:PUM-HD domain-containing protein n=1 Tax=Tagetes erecta TaxID=13708 RepID=A0AAD8L2A5_TARER|nr:hypothetical protein QVD17_10357 [Tagetes erecta]